MENYIANRYRDPMIQNMFRRLVLGHLEGPGVLV